MIERKLFGDDMFGDAIQQKNRGVVEDRFLFPPFSVFNTRDGKWADRKHAWISLGIQSELGRNDGNKEWLMGQRKWMGNKGVELTNISIFDPVLTELSYRWFCPLGGQVVDPFAGGSVRGIVAGCLGFKYWGCDLASQQIEANREQLEKIKPDISPIWVNGDSMDELDNAPEADFVFSCPPYGDLEKYSDDPCDLSAMEYHAFVANYKLIILRACRKLKQNRFACFVVGNFRDKRTGSFRTLVNDTIAAFQEQGLTLYNDIILVTSIGTTSLRVTKQFNHSRKIGKTHQNVLVFVKGDAKEATRVINLSREGEGVFTPPQV